MVYLEGRVPEYMTEDFMGQLIDVVFGLTGSQDQVPSTTAPYRLEFRGLPPRTHHLCVTAQAYVHTLPPSCSLKTLFPSMNLSSGHNITEEDKFM